MKKTVSVLLCAVLLCCTAAGCTSSGDENTSTKDELQDSSIELKITIDSHYDSMDESAVNAYKKLCNAVLNYETEVKFNTGLTDSVNQLFYTSFPQYILVDGIDFLDDNSGVSITYANDEATHKKKLEQFNSAVSSIMNECGFNSVGKNEYLLNVYSYIAQNFTVDNSVTNVFETVIQKKGMSSSLSGLFEYLLLQSDIEASHLINLEQSSIAKMISLASFNGSTYYFDVAMETDENKGRGLEYFAMDTERAQSSAGDGFVYTDNTEPDYIEDDTYSALETCTSYELSGTKVSANVKGDKDFEFDLN